MGNCLKISSADDISLLRSNEVNSRHGGINTGDSSDQLTNISYSEIFGQSTMNNQTGRRISSLGIGSSNSLDLSSNSIITTTINGSSAVNTANNILQNQPINVQNQIINMQLTDEEQIRIAKRMGLVQHLPILKYDGCMKSRECAICMIEFVVGDTLRYLPCMHTYHVNCIDDWLIRSLTCPSCLEPVDSALITSYEST